MKNMYKKITEKILKKTIAGKNYVAQDFFVGVTDNPKKRLFLEHKVDQNNDLYVYLKANSPDEANEAFEELFQLDMNGAPKPEHKSGDYVYCYHINGRTIECPTCY